MFWIAIAIIAGTVALLALNGGGPIAGLSEDELAWTVRLAIIGLLAAGALAAFRVRVGEALKAALAWTAIAAVLAAVYAHRTELQAVALRTVSTFAPGLAVETGGDTDELQVTRSRDGHFRIRARLNDATATLLVDTGASSTTLSARDAERAGIDPRTLTYTTPVRTANGTTTVAAAILDELAVGSIVLRNVPVFVARAGQLEQSLLGLSFLSKLSSYEVRGDQLYLRR